MMAQTGKFAICDPTALDAKVLQMDYTGDTLSMVFILPNKVDGLSDVQKRMENFNYLECMKRKYETEIEVRIPKFSIKSEYKMKNVLSEMGIKDAFTEKADLSGIAGDNLYVDEIYHQAYINVNEEGTEATAATGTVVGRRSMGKKFFCDHPFMFRIVENTFGTILFEGIVTNPFGGVDE